MSCIKRYKKSLLFKSFEDRRIIPVGLFAFVNGRYNWLLDLASWILALSLRINEIENLEDSLIVFVRVGVDLSILMFGTQCPKTNDI